jgi:predicted TIM-barrel enzyme
MAAEILNVVEATPVIGGIEATDPTRRDLSLLLDDFLRAGYSGIINFPTIGMWDDYRTLMEKKGYGFDVECALVEECRRREVFTMAYVFSPEDAEAMVRSGADCIVAHAGPTEGGLVGPEYDQTLDYALKSLQEIFDASRAVREDVFCLGHGGPFDTPETVQTLYGGTTAEGFVGASSIERIPVERAVIQVVKDLKGQTVSASNQEKGRP